MTPNPTPTTAPESTRPGAVHIPRPGLPGELLSKRPELDGIGVGAFIVRAGVSA